MKNSYSRRRAALFLCLFALAGLAVFVSPSSSGQGRARVREDIGRSLAGYDELQLDPAAVAEEVRKDGRLTLATARGTFELELEPSDIRAANYRAVVVEEDGVAREIERTPSRTYKGTVRGLAGAQARFSIDEQKIEGLIVAGDEIYFVEPSKNFSPAAGAKDFVFYPESSVKAESFGECATTLAQRVGERAAGVAPGGSAGSGGRAATTKGMTAELFGPKPEVEVATEADAEYFVASGNDANAANNEILSIMNQVDGIYDAQLGIKMRIVFQRVWAVAPASDPYTETNARRALDQLRNVYDGSFAAGTLPARDLTHMWTGKTLLDDDGDPGTIGIAYIAAVCDAPAFSYGISQRAFASNNIRRVVLTAHEIGHNFSAEHPDEEEPVIDSCAGTIMNSTVTPSTNFCQFSLDQITDHVTVKDSCLTRLAQPGCTYAVAPAYKRFGIEGGAGTVNVSTSLPSCDWKVADGAPWLNITAGAAGVGPGVSTYSIAPNTGGPLATVVDIAGQKLKVVQDTSPNCALVAFGEGNTSGVLAPSDCRSG
ncbi:MAG: hypothetical protein H0T60_15360, partial [Acidobacteria bacterium]|nr:hypothetical protein [Acidobacteriota bacterium]